jgi:hypothetical protein
MRLLLLTLLFLALAASADIYRWTDEQGNTVFGDTPPEGVEAQPVRLREPTVTPAMPEAREILERRPAPDTGEPARPYERLRIASPGDDEPVRANDGNFSVRVDIRPDLLTDRGHELRLLMDGDTVQTGQRPVFDLVNVDRGTHRLQVQVLNRSGEVIQESDPVVFHLLRHHIN